MTVEAKTIGKNKGFVNVGGDYHLAHLLLVNTNASLKSLVKDPRVLMAVALAGSSKGMNI